MQETSSLFVGRFTPRGTEEELREALRKNFSEWGQLVSVKVWRERGFAFVKYALKSSVSYWRLAIGERVAGGIRQGSNGESKSRDKGPKTGWEAYSHGF